jgi:hypothetical protein
MPQEGTVEQVGASAIGVVLAGSLGHAAPARTADRLSPSIEELSAAIKREAEK